MRLTSKLAELVRACFTGIWVESHEHLDAMTEIAQLCRQEGWRLAAWDIERGLYVPGQPAPAPGDAGGQDPLAAIRAQTVAQVSRRLATPPRVTSGQSRNPFCSTGSVERSTRRFGAHRAASRTKNSSSHTLPDAPSWRPPGTRMTGSSISEMARIAPAITSWLGVSLEKIRPTTRTQSASCSRATAPTRRMSS